MYDIVKFQLKKGGCKMRAGLLIILLFLAVNFSGCTFIFQKGRRSDIEKIQELSQQLDDLRATKRLLEERLSKEIGDRQVSLELKDKGLVITFLADVLFDLGTVSTRGSAKLQ